MPFATKLEKMTNSSVHYPFKHWIITGDDDFLADGLTPVSFEVKEDEVSSSSS
jgi:hypothetical protein